MEDEIVSKLRNHLALHTPMTEECHAVYLLLELRKIIERRNDGGYLILRFYCSWAVHHCKDKYNKAIVPIVERIYQSIIAGQKFEEQKFFIPADDSCLEFMSLEHLKKEMEDFFDCLSLSRETFDGEYWVAFRDLLIQVLINQPILDPTEKVKSVSFDPVIKGAARIVIIFSDSSRYTFTNHF